MRYEAKHEFLKWKKWSQFINLSYSIARMHQLSLINNMVDSLGNFNTNYFYSGDCVKEGNSIQICDLEKDEINSFLLSFPGLNLERKIYETTEIEKDGCIYKKGRILLVGWSDLAVPHFCEILKLFVINRQYFALLQELETKSFQWVFNSYEVTENLNMFVYKLSELKNVFPLQKYFCKHTKKTLVNNCYAHFTGGV